MASALLRTTASRGSAFRGVFSAAAGAAGEGLTVRRGLSLAPPPSPIRCLLHSDTKPPKTLEEKVDQMLQEVKQFDEQFERDLTEVLKEYKEALRTEQTGGNKLAVSRGSCPFVG